MNPFRASAADDERPPHIPLAASAPGQILASPTEICQHQESLNEIFKESSGFL
jgi:hypothetical protein